VKYACDFFLLDGSISLGYSINYTAKSRIKTFHIHATKVKIFASFRKKRTNQN
jgi:hypothetical protein